MRRGYHVLACDLRGRGESGGVRDGLGSTERRDMDAIVEYARRRAGSLPLVLHGFGLGASLAIDAAARGVEAVVVIADSPCWLGP